LARGGYSTSLTTFSGTMQLAFAACLALALATVVTADGSEVLPHKKLRQHKRHRHHHGRAHSKVKTKAKHVSSAGQAPIAELVPPAPQSLAPMPQLPAAVNAGPNSYPQLPAVSAMLGSSSQTMQNINAQTRVLEARVVKIQMENEAKMALQKAVFEQKLKSQEDRSRATLASNQHLSNEIADIQANISALQHQAKDIQQENEIMRREMRTLGGKLARGRAFLLSSLKNLDDSKAPQLAVLQKLQARRGSNSKDRSKRAKHAHQRVAANTKQKTAQMREVSFLALGATHAQGAAHVQRAHQPAPGAQPAAGSPNDLVKVLGQAVATLQQEEHLSEAKLRLIFLTNFKAGVKRYAALLADRRKLLTTRKTLLAQQAELRVADDHLRTTNSVLQQQLRSFGLFTQKLAHLALAPTQEATELLRHLPVDVDSGM